MTIQRPDDLKLVITEIDVKIIDRGTQEGPLLNKTACHVYKEHQNVEGKVA